MMGNPMIQVGWRTEGEAGVKVRIEKAEERRGRRGEDEGRRAEEA